MTSDDITEEELRERHAEVESLRARGFNAGLVAIRRADEGQWYIKTWDDVVNGGERVNARVLGTMDALPADRPVLLREWEE